MLLELNGLDVECIIGELPDERERVQTLSIDVALEIGDGAAESDEIADTVDYAELAGRIRGELAKAKCRMIERAAKLVCDICLADPKVGAAEAKVTKSGAVPGLKSASATFRRRRDERLS